MPAAIIGFLSEDFIRETGFGLGGKSLITIVSHPSLYGVQEFGEITMTFSHPKHTSARSRKV
jgi:hypothetical protein